MGIMIIVLTDKMFFSNSYMMKCLELLPSEVGEEEGGDPVPLPRGRGAPAGIIEQRAEYGQDHLGTGCRGIDRKCTEENNF